VLSINDMMPLILVYLLRCNLWKFLVDSQQQWCTKSDSGWWVTVGDGLQLGMHR